MAHCWGYSLLPQAAETTRYKMLPKKYYEFILPQHSCLSLLLSLLLMLMMIITIKDLFRYLACHAISRQRRPDQKPIDSRIHSNCKQR